ncbi:MAG: exodeoxyribonuclease VII large subunit [Bacteroidales bacterium]|nr:exodeoxyribonuclease VII large subunit [Bacteroidales bacterium]
MEFVDLYTLQRDLKEGLEDLFPDRIWVKAEIAQISVKGGGHCYLELVQSEAGTVIAKVRAVIWRSTYNLLNAKMRSVTGADISAGTEVLLLATVNFHEVFGLSLVIDDIDTAFTVGEQQIKRQQTIDRLVKEGLLDRQKALSLPQLPYALAVISAEGAAGLQDFRRQLLENEYGYAYRADLFPAMMQGEGAPDSIFAALDEIRQSSVRYDAVLVLRGGGSDMDLLCFDDYGLAAAIAKMPVPVVTAIGHDKDFHVADMAAHDYVKTPTALADMFLRLTEAADEHVSGFENRLALAFRSRLAGLESKLDLLETRISATDPRNVLKRGFSLVLDSRGVRMNGVRDRKAGDAISVVFADGRLGAEVKEVKKENNG